jgi:hypothetical protein
MLLGKFLADEGALGIVVFRAKGVGKGIANGDPP